MNKILLIGLLLFSSWIFAQEEPAKTESMLRSHHGLKVNFGVGGFENKIKQLDGRITGGALTLGLGWGINETSTIWLTVLGAGEEKEESQLEQEGFFALELGWQYRLRPKKTVQPYGKIGLGAYFLGQELLSYSGGGLALAVGVDWDLSRHILIGAEFQVKGQEYSERRMTLNGTETVVDLNPSLEGESSGILLTLTIR
ncbi:MAG: outer membrane beta-barrel protein [Calditrichia bacterium]